MLIWIVCILYMVDKDTVHSSGNRLSFTNQRSATYRESQLVYYHTFKSINPLNKYLCTQIIFGSKWSVRDLLYVHLSVCLSVCILRTVLCHLCDTNPSTLIVARRSAPMGAGILMFVVWNTIYCAFYNLISCSMLIWLWYIYMNRYIGLILYLIHVYSLWTNIETRMTTSFYLPFCFQ